jgi:hypothetical protein
MVVPPGYPTPPPPSTPMEDISNLVM